MRLFNRSTAVGFGRDHAEALAVLEEWCDAIEEADWKTPSDIKAAFASASFVEGNRVVFNIKGNSYRIIVSINYTLRRVFIKFIGTHAEYDKVNAATVEYKK